MRKSSIYFLVASSVWLVSLVAVLYDPTYEPLGCLGNAVAVLFILLADRAGAGERAALLDARLVQRDRDEGGEDS